MQLVRTIRNLKNNEMSSEGCREHSTSTRFPIRAAGHGLPNCPTRELRKANATLARIDESARYPVSRLREFANKSPAGPASPNYVKFQAVVKEA